MNQSLVTYERINGRHAQQALVEINLLERRIFAKADSWVGMFAKEVAKPSTLLIIARDRTSTKVVAYGVLMLTSLNVHVSKVAVHDSWRRKGVATGLLREGIRIAILERRACSSSLFVAVENLAAAGLYRAIGYEEDALMQDYYRAGRHAYKMICDLQSDRFLQFMGQAASKHGD